MESVSKRGSSTLRCAFDKYSIYKMFHLGDPKLRLITTTLLYQNYQIKGK